MTARFIRLGFLAVLLAAFAAEGAVAQDPAAAAADGTNEGVAVHGHWTITIVRDGEVVERREFENALEPLGVHHLAQVLGRVQTPGPWRIFIDSDGTETLCGNFTGPVCAILDADLTVSVEPDDTVLLDGSAVAERDANLLEVRTSQARCDPTVATAVCEAQQSGIPFTSHVLENPIPVQTGDRIDATVVLSFN